MRRGGGVLCVQNITYMITFHETSPLCCWTHNLYSECARTQFSETQLLSIISILFRGCDFRCLCYSTFTGKSKCKQYGIPYCGTDHIMSMYLNVCWWWWLVTETCDSLILLHILLFWLNDISVSTTTQRDGSYKKLVFMKMAKALNECRNAWPP